MSHRKRAYQGLGNFFRCSWRYVELRARGKTGKSGDSANPLSTMRYCNARVASLREVQIGENLVVNVAERLQGIWILFEAKAGDKMCDNAGDTDLIIEAPH
jgi:hypothetical protein